MYLCFSWLWVAALVRHCMAGWPAGHTCETNWPGIYLPVTDRHSVPEKATTPKMPLVALATTAFKSSHAQPETQQT